jgi:hypothetical protein
MTRIVGLVCALLRAQQSRVPQCARLRVLYKVCWCCDILRTSARKWHMPGFWHQCAAQASDKPVVDIATNCRSCHRCVHVC